MTVGVRILGDRVWQNQADLNRTDDKSSLPVILIESGQHVQHLTIELEQIYPQSMTKIKFELSTKPSKLELEAPGKSGESSGCSKVGNLKVKGEYGEM